jgi:hypothetical protein
MVRERRFFGGYPCPARKILAKLTLDIKSKIILDFL